MSSPVDRVYSQLGDVIIAKQPVVSAIFNHTVSLWNTEECKTISDLMNQVVEKRTAEKERFEQSPETKKLNFSLCVGDLMPVVLTTITVASLFLPVIGQAAAMQYFVMGTSAYLGLNCIYGSSKVYYQALDKLKELKGKEGKEAVKQRKELTIQVFLGTAVMGLGVLLTLIAVAQFPGFNGKALDLANWVNTNLKNNPLPLSAFSVAIMGALALDTWPRIIQRLKKQDMVSNLSLEDIQDLDSQKLDALLQKLIDNGIITENIMTASMADHVAVMLDSLEAQSNTEIALQAMQYIQTLFALKAKPENTDLKKEKEFALLEEKTKAIIKAEKLSKKVLGVRVTQQMLNVASFIMSLCSLTTPLVAISFGLMISANLMAFFMDSKYHYDRNTPYQVPKEKDERFVWVDPSSAPAY